MIELKIEHSFPSKDWDQFVEKSINGTIFHKHSFLSYHGDKFKDFVNIFFVKDQDILAAINIGFFNESGKKIAKSPYGGSYGGYVLSEKIKLFELLEIIELTKDYLKNKNINSFTIIPTPHLLYKAPNEILKFSLLSKDFKLAFADISNVKILSEIKDFDSHLYLKPRVRGKLRKAIKTFKVQENAPLSDFYPILLEDKERHSGAKPTHSFQELDFLIKNFSKEIFCDVAYEKNTGTPAAGLCYIRPTATVITAFYICQKNQFLGLNPLLPLFHEGFKKASLLGIKYFDFGTSSVNGILFEGVARYKSMFSDHYFCREKYVLEL